VNFFDADGLSRKDLAEIDFFATQANSTAPGDHDGLIVQRIVDVRQSGIRTQTAYGEDLCHQIFELPG